MMLIAVTISMSITKLPESMRIVKANEHITDRPDYGTNTQEISHPCQLFSCATLRERLAAIGMSARRVLESNMFLFPTAADADQQTNTYNGNILTVFALGQNS